MLPPRVMIVEDDPGTALLERTTFERAGYRGKQRTNGEIATLFFALLILWAAPGLAQEEEPPEIRMERLE
ncbi:MAG: hypothetical protein GY722_28965, partial [bacterium]|nr:hypothetical protein [bacterium]